MINQLVMQALSTLNVPVSFQKYSGNEITYITFFNLGESGEAFADNLEIQTIFSVQVDIWSKSDYSTLYTNVCSLMIANGFLRETAADLYESDTQTYHKSCRFIYSQNLI